MGPLLHAILGHYQPGVGTEAPKVQNFVKFAVFHPALATEYTDQGEI